MAKATSVHVAKIAARVMAGEPLSRFGLTEPRLGHVAVKEAVLPFARFPGSDVILGPEMKSTGESMGIDQDFAAAYLKAQLGAGVRLPRSGNVLIAARDADKPHIAPLARRLLRLGFHLLATRGTADALRQAEIPVEAVAKAEEGSPNVIDLLNQGKVQLLIDTALWAEEVAGGCALRIGALQRRVPYCSRLTIARAVVDAIERQQDWELSVRPLQSYAQPHPPLRLFIRQPLTQSGNGEKEIVDGVLRIVDEIGRRGVPLEFLTGNTPLSNDNFREHFEQEQGLPFNPVNFRRYRLGQLRRADAFLYIRTAMSESGAFEVCYNVFAEPRAPMFIAVWKHAPIKTTLLRDLGEVSDVTYREFEHPEELRYDLRQFLHRVAEAAPDLPHSSNVGLVTQPVLRPANDEQLSRRAAGQVEKRDANRLRLQVFQRHGS